MNIRQYFIGLFAVLSVIGSAGTLHAQRMDLDTVLAISREQYPLLKARAASVNAAGREVKASQSEYIPRLSVQHQYTYSTNNSVTGSFYPNGGTVISPSGGIRAANIYDGTFGSFTSALLEWNVITFGKVAANVKTARANLAVEQAAYENEVFQHQVKVADAYLLVLIGRKLEAIQRSNLRRAEQFRNVVEAGVRAGMRAGVDSALAHAEYSKAQLLLQESERNARAQQYQLMALIAQPELDSLPIDSMTFYTSLPVTLDTSSAQFGKSPLLRTYRARVEATQWRSKAIGRTFLPSVSLVASGWARGSGVSNTDDSFHNDFQSGTKYQVYNYLFGVATRWTLSDYASTRQRHKGEEQRVIRDKELYNEQYLQQKRQWREGEMQYDVARAQARTAPVQLAAAQQAYSQAGARYSSGLTDLPTLLQSMVTLNRAEADVAIAYSNVWRSLLMMAAVKGELPLFLNAIK